MARRNTLFFINPPVEDFSASDFYSMPYGMLGFLAGLENAGVPYFYYDFLHEDFALCGETYQPSRKGTARYPQIRIPKPEALQPVPRYYKRFGNALESFDRYLRDASLQPEATTVCINTDFTYRADGVIRFVDQILPKYGFKPDKIILGGTASRLIPEYFRSRLPGICIYPDFPAGTQAPIPSVPASGLFSLGPYKRMRYLPFRLSRFCPDSCPYCASPFLRKAFGRSPLPEPAVSPAALNRYLKEGAARMGTGIAVPVDDALLYFHRCLPEILSGLDLRLFTPNGLHLRFVDRECALNLKSAGFQELRFGVESLSSARMSLRQKKILSVSLQEKVDLLREAGFPPKQINFNIIYGLRGQCYEDVLETIEKLRETGCGIFASAYSPVPHTPMYRALNRNLGGLFGRQPSLTNNNTLGLWNPEFDEERISSIKLRCRRPHQDC